MRTASRQLGFRFPGRGGKRKGAGRKPKGEQAGVSHHGRPALASRHPVHVTLRVHPHVWNLRSRRCFSVIARAFRAATRRAARGASPAVGAPSRSGHHRGAFRLVEYSVQGNHLHLIVEAADAGALARGLQSLEIRIAKGVNALMGTRGAVFADRYHAHILRTPTEVANALGYVRGNFAIHAARQGAMPIHAQDPRSSVVLIDGSLPDEQGPPLVAPPHTWLLSVGWRRGR
jgi:hypothetical protein